MSEHQELAGLIWSITDALRDSFKASQYGSVILPLTVLRRLDCLQHADDRAAPEGQRTSELDNRATSVFSRTHDADPAAPVSGPQLSDLVLAVIHGLPADAARVLELFDLERTVVRLERAGLLRQVIDGFAALDLGPSAVSASQMGQVFERLVRLVTETFGGESAGEHYSPPDITGLMASLLLAPDRETPSRAAPEVGIYDPACGTGGLFSAFESYLRTSPSPATVQAFGQEINSQTCSIARSLLLMKGADSGAIAFGNSLTHDQHAGATFDYLAAVPPFGAEWKRIQAEVTHEADTLGSAGRFGAGLPRVSDSSFLFLQHMIAHMKPAGEGGSRIAIIFNASPLFTGAAGSGESEIRRWILQNDLLEGIIALPDRLFLHTGIPTYLWLLSNRKRTANKGKVIVLDARAHCSTLRKPLGSKQQYITDEQIVEITRLYAEAADGSSNAETAGKGAARLLPTEYFGYQRVMIDRPLRLRFAVADTTITQLEEARVLARFQAADALLPVLRSLSGETWPTKAAFETRLSLALAEAGMTDRALRPALRQAVLRAVGITDSAGEVQRDSKGALLPDLDLRYYAKVPLSESVDAFIRREIAPEFPDAWIDRDAAQLGYEIRPTLFSASQWAVGFGPLAKVARQVRPRPFSERTDSGVPLLTGPALGSVDTAADLPELSGGTGRSVANCTDGDIVGQFANWRVLPTGFGDALTPLTVLRPLHHRGRTLCEWLNARKSSEYGLNQQISMDTPIPIDAILDPEFDELLDDLHTGRIGLTSTMSKILPNVFRESTTDIEDARRTAQTRASEARLIGELVRPLEDPVWRAEWSYPYHIAGLARQYRIATSPAERKDVLLKLGESVARSLGILALAVMIRREGRFTRNMRDRFRNGGATFGTWNRLIQDLLTDGEVSELRELGSSLGPGGAHTLLTSILDIRNEAGHEYGVRAAHELEGEVAKLEPTVVAALESVSWLSGLHWNLVERCEYTGTGFRLIGQRLRGSHPEWEPFERSSIEPLTPHRIYVEGPSSANPIALSPIASVELCPTCRTRELFLLKEVTGKVITLRSGKDHEINRELD